MPETREVRFETSADVKWTPIHWVRFRIVVGDDKDVVVRVVLPDKKGDAEE